jgi:hypothetical protein
MAKDIQEMVRENLINALEDAGRRALKGASKRANGAVPSSSNGGLSAKHERRTTMAIDLRRTLLAAAGRSRGRVWRLEAEQR